MRHRERERATDRERQRHRQREKQAPCWEPDMGLDPWSPGSGPGLQAALNRCTTRAALIPIYDPNDNFLRIYSFNKYIFLISTT